MKKKIFEYISMHFYGLNLGPPWRGTILDPGTFIWTNLVKDHYAMLYIKF